MKKYKPKIVMSENESGKFVRYEDVQEEIIRVDSMDAHFRIIESDNNRFKKWAEIICREHGIVSEKDDSFDFYSWEITKLLRRL